MALFKSGKTRSTSRSKSSAKNIHYQYAGEVPKPVKVFDKKDSDIFGILLFDQFSIEKITTLSGMTKKSEEYQVHYHSLIYQVKHGEQFLNISIPLCYFNYKQQVTGGSVKFTLVEVNEVSDITKPLAEAKAAEIFDTDFHKYVMEQFPDAEVMIAPLQQIHRHPGRMDCFSGTDYDKNPEDPGICFPFLMAPDNTPSFGSIICQPYNNSMSTEMIHTEYRQVSGSVESEAGITYLHGKSVTYIKGHEVYEKDGFDQWISANNVVESYRLGDRINEDKLNENVESLFIEFENLDFEPSMDLVVEENVTKTSYTNGYNYANRNLLVTPQKTETINKYGKNENKSLTLLEKMQQDIKDGKDGIDKTEEEMIQEAINIQDVEDKKIRLPIEIHNATPVSDSEGLFPVDFSDMTPFEENQYADLLRDEIVGCGVSKLQVDNVENEIIFKWAEDLNLILDTTPIDSFSDVKDGTWAKKLKV